MFSTLRTKECREEPGRVVPVYRCGVEEPKLQALCNICPFEIMASSLFAASTLLRGPSLVR